jgi:hypothetical protein
MLSWNDPSPREKRRNGRPPCHPEDLPIRFQRIQVASDPEPADAIADRDAAVKRLVGTSTGATRLD